MQNIPTVSFLIPTLNSERVLEDCLKQVTLQNYPKSKIEIIIADGGSKDKTIEIAKKYKAKIFNNPLKTGEAGKAVALKHANGELVALVDSDNIIPSQDWLKEMVAPFADEEVVGSEPWEYTYRLTDGFIDRYCALFGMNDPLCYFLGNYDRLNSIDNQWTRIKLKQEDKGSWLKVELKLPNFPTVGANGTIFRRRVLTENLNTDYLFDIDILASLACRKPVLFAKVKNGIIHLYCGSNLNRFCRKQKRRVNDYFYYQQLGIRKYPWKQQSLVGQVKFIFYCLLIFPLFFQALKGYIQVKDRCWLFHPVACWITLLVYGQGRIVNIFKTTQVARKNWGQ